MQKIASPPPLPSSEERDQEEEHRPAMTQKLSELKDKEDKDAESKPGKLELAHLYLI